MQPDLLSPEREEEQSAPLSTTGNVQAKGTLLEPTAAIEPERLTPIPMGPKKRARLNFVAIGLAMLVFILVLSFAWVGYWTYTLNNALTATQGQLTALEAEHARLQTEYTALTSENEKLKGDLIQSRADLEQANTDLTTAESDLSKAQDKAKKLDTQIDTSGKLAEILFVWTTSDNPSDVFKIDTLINETDNQELISKWNTLTRSPSDDTFGGFMDYLVLAIRNSLR